jgi:hypothetical protein
VKDLGIGRREIIKMDLQERGSEGVNWNHLARDRYKSQALVNKALNL